MASDDPPVDATVVGPAASMDPTGTTLVATVVAGALAAVVGLGWRVARAVGARRRRPDDPLDGSSGADGSSTIRASRSAT